MRTSICVLLLVCGALVSSSCGSTDKDDAPGNARPPARTADQEEKLAVVAKAKTRFEANASDLSACQSLAMAYVALASPTPSSQGSETVVPADRKDSLRHSVETLERCAALDGDDRAVQQMLASSLVATQEHEKALPILAKIARTARGPERANAYYSWGSTAILADDSASALEAWTTFLKLAPKDDPRVDQVKSSLPSLRKERRG